jgi:hypothetical protein
MRTGKNWQLVILFSLIMVFRANAAVIDSSFYGFTVKQEVILKGSPMEVYNKMYRDIGKWWSSDHTFSGKASNLSIDATAGGCFCEKLDDGGSVRHMMVVYADPGKMLRLQGGLGPLQALAVTGTITFSFTESGEDTKLTCSYAVGGYSPGGIRKLAPIVDMVLGQQLKNLQKFCLN